ncbi:MAG: hypothetical protein EXQ68_03190 [Acidimicrobiia bacterium]|nr:hypothetical protein [Acidimicrobiia bacterium]
MISFLLGDNAPKNLLSATNNRLGDRVGDKKEKPSGSGEQAHKNKGVFLGPGESRGKLVMAKPALTSTFEWFSTIPSPTTTTTLYLIKDQKMGKTRPFANHQETVTK